MNTHFLEGVFVSDVVHYDSAMAVAIVDGTQCVVALLTSCVL